MEGVSHFSENTVFHKQFSEDQGACCIISYVGVCGFAMFLIRNKTFSVIVKSPWSGFNDVGTGKDDIVREKNGNNGY